MYLITAVRLSFSKHILLKFIYDEYAVVKLVHDQYEVGSGFMKEF